MKRIDGIKPVARRNIEFRALNRGFEVQAREDVAVISIYEEIGYWGVTADNMRRQLDSIDAKEIELRLNSPGGDVFDGIAIYNDLLSHPASVKVKISGLAASAASLIAMAGDTIEMADTAFLMIHNAWAVAMGDHQVMAEMQEMLRKVDGSLARTYQLRTGASEDEVREWMDAETWFSAEEAKDAKFIDQIINAEQPKALFDLSMYARVPGKLKRQIEAGLRDAGLSQREAKAAISEGFPQRDAGSKTRDGSVVPDIYQQTANLLRGMKI